MDRPATIFKFVARTHGDSGKNPKKSCNVPEKVAMSVTPWNAKFDFKKSITKSAVCEFEYWNVTSLPAIKAYFLFRKHMLEIEDSQKNVNSIETKVRELDDQSKKLATQRRQIFLADHMIFSEDVQINVAATTSLIEEKDERKKQLLEAQILLTKAVNKMRILDLETFLSEKQDFLCFFTMLHDLEDEESFIEYTPNFSFSVIGKHIMGLVPQLQHFFVTEYLTQIFCEEKKMKCGLPRGEIRYFNDRDLKFIECFPIIFPNVENPEKLIELSISDEQQQKLKTIRYPEVVSLETKLPNQPVPLKDFKHWFDILYHLEKWNFLSLVEREKAIQNFQRWQTYGVDVEDWMQFRMVREVMEHVPSGFEDIGCYLFHKKDFDRIKLIGEYQNVPEDFFYENYSTTNRYADLYDWTDIKEVIAEWNEYSEETRMRFLQRCNYEYHKVNIGHNFFEMWNNFFEVSPEMAEFIWIEVSRDELLKITNVPMNKFSQMKKYDLTETKKFIARQKPLDNRVDAQEQKLRQELKSIKAQRAINFHDEYLSSKNNILDKNDAIIKAQKNLDTYLDKKKKLQKETDLKTREVKMTPSQEVRKYRIACGIFKSK